MTIEIISIGNELLAGHTMNTNASKIAQALLPHGFSVDRITTLPDQLPSLKEGIQEAMERASFLIITGGLGPTGDDLTRGVMAELYQTTLEHSEKIAADLIRRFGKELPTLSDQAMVLKGATIIPNPLGTAPGFILEGKSVAIVLPGVPSQMEVMLNEVVKYLEKKTSKNHYVETLYLALLSEQEVDPYLRKLEQENPGIDIGICPGYGTLSIYFHGRKKKKLIPVRNQIAKHFHTHVYSTTDKRIEVALHEWMVKHQKTLAAGESCSGGHLAATLTALPGASDYFLGSIVSYSNHLKKTALNVSPKTLETKGAVSKETVIEMGEGVKKLTGADYIITLSGIAGPTGGTSDKPVGTIWSTIQTPEKTYVGLIPLKPSAKKRSILIRYSVTYLLASLYRYLTYNIEPYT
ncbi:MAG: nicotinamide-nucleotide amidohydrolase family protein [Chlamydiia bacterium]|nr:nicotinamide-nucleotide amidohydrolase family protein [Chlamydiia bacterium]